MPKTKKKETKPLKRKWHFPRHGVTIEATTLEEAMKKLKAKK